MISRCYSSERQTQLNWFKRSCWMLLNLSELFTFKIYIKNFSFNVTSFRRQNVQMKRWCNQRVFFFFILSKVRSQDYITIKFFCYVRISGEAFHVISRRLNFTSQYIYFNCQVSIQRVAELAAFSTIHVTCTFE